jgi:hypothetical protein
MELKIGQVWKHYKGTPYKIMLLAKDSEGENMTDMVVYQDSTDESKIWVQSVARFLEGSVEWEGKTVPRFEFVSDN